jgi:hypothetical protein
MPVIDIDLDEEEIWWRKTGGGTHRLKRKGKPLKIIKPNQKFKARPSEISEGLRDIIIPLQNLPEEKPLPVIPAGYSLKYKGSGWYDVVDGDDKVMNEKSLRLNDAQKLIDSLTGQ